MTRTCCVSLFLLVLLFSACMCKIDQEREFLEWAKLQGIEWDEEKVGLRSLPLYQGHRGIFALNDLEKGETLIEIPFTAMMNEASFLSDSFIPEDLDLTATNIMALRLLYEKKSEESKWTEYIQFLPEQIHTTLFYSEQELEYLQASTLVENTKMRKENALYYYDLISDRLVNHDSWKGKHISEEEWLWALSILWSRAFSVKVDGTPMGSLVPFADMFNAADLQRDPLQVKVKLGDSSLTYYTTKTISAGEEILMPYGKYKKHSNAELLLDYGFVRPSNPDDIVCIKNSYYYKSFSNDELKTDLLYKVGLWRKAFCFTAREFPHELVWVMRVLSFITEDLDRIKSNTLLTLLRESEGNDRSQPMHSVPFGVANEFAAIKLATKATKKALEEYETTQEEDEILLRKQYHQELELSYPHYASLIIRSSEKRILENIILQLSEYSYHLDFVSTNQDIIIQKQ